MSDSLLEPDLIRQLDQLALTSRKLSTGRMKGERRSRRRGSGADFADYRNYAPGDDLRFLDWKIYGRLEKLFLKLFLEEEDLRVHILLDTSASMRFGEPDKLLYAKRVAAALGYICLTKMDTLIVKTFGDRLLQTYGPKRGRGHGAAYLRFLSALQPAETTALLPAFKTFAQTARGRGLAIVISDFYDFNGYEEALRQLFARDFEVLVLHVLSPQELAPAYTGDLRLADEEFHTTTDVSMNRRVMELYRRTLSAFCGGLRDFTIRRGGYYLLASTEAPFERLVLDALRRQGILQ